MGEATVGRDIKKRASGKKSKVMRSQIDKFDRVKRNLDYQELHKPRYGSNFDTWETFILKQYYRYTIN